MNILRLAILTSALLAGSCAFSDDCIGLYKQKQSASSADFKQILQQIVTEVFSDECGATKTVASQILKTTKKAHLRLEDKKAFDPAEAQANLDKAMTDSAVTEQIQAAKSQVNDEDSRLFVLATILDSEGYYPARNLVVRQIQQKLGIKPD